MMVNRKRRNVYTVLFVIGICISILFAVKDMAEAALILGVLDIIVFILLIRQNRLLYNASLILDNRILSVPSAVISIQGDKRKRDVEETVVSTFGIMMGDRIYKWGSDGVRGVQLRAMEIDREWIYLTFGDGIKTMRVELLHGIADKEEVMKMKQRLRRETGVELVVRGW
jgi:hypothetical protein